MNTNYSGGGGVSDNKFVLKILFLEKNSYGRMFVHTQTHKKKS